MTFSPNNSHFDRELYLLGKNSAGDPVYNSTAITAAGWSFFDSAGSITTTVTEAAQVDLGGGPDLVGTTNPDGLSKDPGRLVGSLHVNLTGLADDGNQQYTLMLFGAARSNPAAVAGSQCLVAHKIAGLTGNNASNPFLLPDSIVGNQSLGIWQIPFRNKVGPDTWHSEILIPGIDETLIRYVRLGVFLAGANTSITVHSAWISPIQAIGD